MEPRCICTRSHSTFWSATADDPTGESLRLISQWGFLCGEVQACTQSHSLDMSLGLTSASCGDKQQPLVDV